jgi:abhydrolase domain-containing protein 12
LNVKITTSDNINIGAWFILSDPFYQSLPFPPSTSTLQSNVSAALASRPTILVLHGNSATRAMWFRVTHYQLFSSRLGVNVLAIDYRGFADSEGTPSEEGLGLDARAAFDWLVQQGAKPEDILIFGHSLGTSVATSLAVQLTRDDVAFRGLVLSSPFSSLRAVLDGYTTFELPPLMKPLGLLSLQSESTSMTPFVC